MSKKKKYIIVESPAKAKTIKGILGPEYEVFASMGHIVDLPKSKFGVDLKNDFEPQFTVIKGKEKIVEKIKAISKVGEIFIASDMDREGEAIAWHVARLTNTLGKRNRIIFSEITPRVIKEAVKNPRKIDMNKVHAQLARRILDRIVGYSLSPVLWKNFKSNLSAGRVQSATLKLVCDREREILRFVPKKYHRVVVKFHGLEAEMITKEKTFLEEDVLKELQSIEELVVEEKTVSRKKFSPPDPFKTSSLQQEAYAKLGFSVAKTMLLAQQLYEGVETKEGHIAFITYMRTDSTRVSDYAKEAARELIEKDFGKEYIGTGRRKKSRTARIQDAHEAIRPTDVFMTPEKISKYLNPDQRKLYELIWKRFFASQMKPSEYEETRFVLRSKDGKYRFKGSILKRIFDGYERVWKTERNVGDFPFEEGEIVKPVEVEIKELETKPKPRYTEGTLVKEMERLGIGRPSTYASTIKLLLSRKYVKKIRGYLYPTVIGSVVMDYLEKKYADIVDISFTAEMEKELDEVEQGKKTDKVVLQDFYRTFSKVFNENDRIIINYPTDQKCSCGKDMVLSFGRYGFYLKCECGKSRSVRNDEVAVIENGKMFIGRKNDEDSTSDGGTSREREVSLRSGERVKKALDALRYEYVVFDVGRNFLEEAPKLKEFDLVFNVLHGTFGEDGSLQSILDFLGVRYTGSDAFSSMLCFDKLLAYRFLKDFVKIPNFVEVKEHIDSSPVGYPCVVKPRREGSSIGVFICESDEEFQRALKEDLPLYGSVIVQEYIPGREMTVSIIETEEGFKVLPILELRPKRRKFYDYIAKYTEGETEFLLPAPLKPEEEQRVKETALRAFTEAGCRGFGRVDGIFFNGEFFFLEINTVPGLTELSDLPASAKAAGIEFEELIDIIIKSAFLKGE